MKKQLPIWMVIATIAVVTILVVVWLWKANAGPQLPANYDPNAPAGSKPRYYPPEGFKMPNDPEPPAPPAGVSMYPGGPTHK